MIYNFLSWIFIFLLVFLLLCVIAVFLVWLRYFVFFVAFHKIAIQFIWFSVGTQVEFIFPHEMANKFQYKNSGEFFHSFLEHSSTLYGVFFGLTFSNWNKRQMKKDTRAKKERANFNVSYASLIAIIRIKMNTQQLFSFLPSCLCTCTYTHQIYCACGRIRADQRQCI